jgi:lipoprotein-anchoring transpeptidase ErfK/SrfK
MPFRRILRASSALAVSLVLSGCIASGGDNLITGSVDGVGSRTAIYGPRPNETHPMPATNVSGVDKKYLRQQVRFNGPQAPGTIVVDTNNRYLYLVQPNGSALRYGIGVGKAGLAFSGSAVIGRKAEWPTWTPTSDMIQREPERNLPWKNGMPGGLGNPLGPRALYLYDNGRDTMFRIHGTTEPQTIGKAVSSGCIRMFNQDVIDLYQRVPAGTQVVVLHNSHPLDQFGDAMAGVADSLGRGLSNIASALPAR